MDIGISGSVLEASSSRAATAIHPTKLVPVADAKSWGRLLAQSQLPHLPQSFAYGEGKVAKGWQVRRVMFEQGERPVAIATILERGVLGLRVLARLNRGPLLLDPTLSADAIIAVYTALHQRCRGPLLIAPALPHGPLSSQILKAAGFRLRHDNGWHSGRIDLSGSEEQIWGGFSSGFRNRVRQGEKSGASVHVMQDGESYEWLLERHVANMRDKGFAAADPTLLRAMRDCAPEDVTVLQLQHHGTAVAGMSVVRFGDCAEYHIGWFGPEGRKINAGNLLMWAAIKDMQRRGVRQFDVGGLKAGDGYTQFKRTMRPAEFRLAGEWMSF